jgi:hypothetical protein
MQGLHFAIYEMVWARNILAVIAFVIREFDRMSVTEIYIYAE